MSSTKKSWLPWLRGRAVWLQWCPTAAMHTTVSSHHARDFFFKELWQRGVLSIFFCIPLWSILRSTKCSVKEEQSGCLDVHTFYSPWALVGTFFLSPLRPSVKFLSIYSCLLYPVSFKRKNNVLICSSFFGGASILSHNLFSKEL